MIEKILGFNTIIAALDIVIVAFILYWLMLMFKGTRAERMLWGIAIIVVVYFASQRFELLTLHWILSNFLSSIVIFIIVVFQQDIRRALVQMGKPFSTREAMKAGGVLEVTVKAAQKMSETRTGGILVLERSIDLGDFIGEDAGIELDAKVSKELILSIFNTASPVHDGAIIIRNGRVFKAGAILPLTNKELSNSLGTRHRAAIGLAEETDAAIIVVSEETGEMTLVFEDGIYPDLAADKLLSDLKQLFAFKGYPKKAMFPWRAPSK
ncbi:MAG: TIGR00159 family protein [Deltaproteobacteria bacterium GWA2_55_10]|nr:MAG: TIGR00159 family protein [Deltaproteobacteria bacterium GWA2_55_10]